MYADINLVIDDKNRSPKREKIQKFKNISFAILFFVAFSSIVLFLINLRFSVNSIKKEQQVIIQNLSAYDQVAARMFLLNSRLSDISTILGNRKNYNGLLNEITSDVPPSVLIDELSIGNEGLTVGLSSVSLLDLNDYLDKHFSFSSKSLTSITLNSLSSSSEGYTMQITAKLK